jgi:hypothetical protein
MHSDWGSSFGLTGTLPGAGFSVQDFQGISRITLKRGGSQKQSFCLVLFICFSGIIVEISRAIVLHARDACLIQMPWPTEAFYTLHIQLPDSA